MIHAMRRVGRCAGTLALLAASSGAAHAQISPQSTQADEGRVNKGNWVLANRFSTAALRAITYTQAVQPRFLGKSDTADKLLGSLVISDEKARILLGWKPPVDEHDQLRRMWQAHTK